MVGSRRDWYHTADAYRSFEAEHLLEMPKWSQRGPNMMFWSFSQVGNGEIQEKVVDDQEETTWLANEHAVRA